MKTQRLLPIVLSLGLAGAACADGTDLMGGTMSGPDGTGGFDPGTTTGTVPSGTGANGAGANGTGASGTGASSTTSTTSAGGTGGTSGAGGTGGVVNPTCDDAQKRCAHLFTYPAGGETTVEVRGDFAPDGWSNGVAMSKNGGAWEADVPIPWNAPVQYKYVVDGAWIADPQNPDQVDDGFGGKNSLIAGETCETWTCEEVVTGSFDWRDGVIYFAFVDRFLDGDPGNNGGPTGGVASPADYRGGDFAGVQQKVESGYFNDLGVNVLWLSVPLDNADVAGMGTDGHLYSGYHGYWPRDLNQTEPRFGSMAALKSLVDGAHQKGIKVILDYAMNHVHETSPVYAQHTDWFWPKNLNGEECVCGSSVCPWDDPYAAKRCWFTDYLPDFDFTNAAARKYSIDNAMWWIQQTGIDGFRLDAVKHIEDSWLLDLRARVTAEVEPVTGQHFYMVGETYTSNTGLIKYYVNPSMLDGQFDFPLRARLIRSVLMRDGGGEGPMSALDGFLAYNDTYYGAGALMSTFIGNHDVPRSIHFAEDGPAWGSEWADGKDRAWNNQPGQPGGMAPYERLCNAYTLLFTSRGLPLVYYGDEVAMAGAGDPDNRRMMQWSGYSAGQSRVLDHVKKLGAIRAAHAALRRGARASVSSTADTMVYKMTQGADVVWVAMNRSDAAQSVSGLPSGALTDLLTGSAVSGPSTQVPARSSLILVAP